MSATTPVCKIISVPGPQGAAGADGDDGSDGIDSSSLLGVGFTMPAFNADTPSLLIGSSLGFTVGQIVYAGLAGWMRVQSKADATHLVLRNLEDGTNYTENATPGTVIASGQRVSPGGLQGPTGGIPSPTLDDLSPTTSKGQILVDDGANAPNASLVAHGPETDGKYLKWNAASVDGTTGENPWPATSDDNRLVRFDGVTGRLTQNGVMAETDSGDLQISTGNAKGTNATDLQTQRSAVTQVASGATSTISGGRNNTGSGIDSAIGGGKDNVASGVAAAIPGGDSNQAGAYALAAGRQCLATGPYCVATGFQSAANAHGMRAHSGGVFATYTDANIIDVVLRNSTTNATPTALFMDGASVKITPSGGQAIGFRGTVVGVEDGGECAFWSIQGLVATGPVLVAAVTSVVIAASGTITGTWGQAANVTVTVVGADLVVTVTGVAANNIRWHCDLRFNVAGWIP